MGGLFIAVVVVLPARNCRRDDRPDHSVGRLEFGNWTAWARGRSSAAPDAQRRPNRGSDHNVLQHRFSARARIRHRVVRRLQGGRRSQSLYRLRRAARHHRPERRRQDHRARSDLRPHQGVRRLDQVQGPGDHRLQGAGDRPPRHRAQVPDADHLRRPHRVRESRILGAARPRRRRRAVLEAHR